MVPDTSATFKGTYRETSWRRGGGMSDGEGTVIFPASGRALVGLVDAARYRAAVEEAARC
ncbi:MAG: hypothetical protein ACREM3_03010 [Candidatus Rokuibacteriota bacterium]